MLHEGEMRRSEDEFSDTISRGMSAAVAIVNFQSVSCAAFLKHEAKEPLSCCCLLTVAAM